MALGLIGEESILHFARVYFPLISHAKPEFFLFLAIYFLVILSNLHPDSYLYLIFEVLQILQSSSFYWNLEHLDLLSNHFHFCDHATNRYSASKSYFVHVLILLLIIFVISLVLAGCTADNRSWHFGSHKTEYFGDRSHAIFIVVVDMPRSPYPSYLVFFVFDDFSR